MKNLFTDMSSPITDKDIKFLENQLNYKFPKSFVQLYKNSNGGCPTLDWLPHPNQEPTIVQYFFPIQGIITVLEESVLKKYKEMTKIGILPYYLVPFATDPGGNFYSLNMQDNTVYYSLTEEPSHQKIYKSFSDFFNSLTNEDDAYL